MESSLEPHRLAYLSEIPADIPAGFVVVHNHVRPARRLGTRGFRAWLAQPSARVELCDCGWAPELAEHYRVARQDRERGQLEELAQ